MIAKQAEEIAQRVKQEEIALARQLVRIMQELDSISHDLEEVNMKNEATQQVRLNLARGSRR